MLRIMKRCVLVVLLSVTALAAPGFGQTTFEFGDVPRFTFPVQGAPPDSVSFWVFSKNGEVADAEVRVKDIKDPDGHSRDFSAVTATLESAKITPEGARVSLKLTPSLFNKPGEYRIILLFKSRTAAAAKVTPGTVTPIIVHPAADINVEEVKNQTFDVSRPWPFSQASTRSFRFPLTETTGKAQLGVLSWSDQGIFVKDTKTRVPGSVSVVPAQSASAQGGEPPAFNLTLEGLERAGSFETNLVVNSPNFAARKVIPVRINVADKIYFPAAVIFLGVFAGLIVNHVSTRWRPSQVNRLQLMRLREELGRWRERVRVAAKAERVGNLWVRLRNAEEANEIGDTAQVRTQLAAIETELDAFRKEEATAKAAAREALAQAQAQADAYEQQFGEQFEPEEESALQDIRDRFADVERLIDQGQVDFAKEKQTVAGARFLSLRKRRLTSRFDELKARFDKLKPLTSVADQKPARDIIAEAEKLLGQNKLDEASAKLDALSAALEELEMKLEGVEHEPGDGSESLSHKGLAPEAAPRLRTRIRITPEPAARTTDVNIEFDIDDQEELLRDGDRIRWTFGEPGAQKEGGTRSTYQYQEYGDYRVRAEVLREDAGGERLIFTEPLTVLPGAQTRQRWEILGQIKVADIVLSAIALLVALATALNTFYFGKPFGTLSDYLIVLLWGFGIEQGVRSIADVLKKFAPPAGGSA